ncbi:MAG: VWA domain-containing protein, partial [Candidatus Sulfotelmatobacter sp.]
MIRPWNLSPVRTWTILRGPSLPLLLSLSRVLVLIAVCACFGGPVLVLGQTDVNDVHVVPRPVEKAKTEEVTKDSIVSSSLNTHIRPLKVSTDLVLVPVTITDPMNRLVTGLEKENFQLFEGSSGQEIKTFSSEDAPVSLGVIFDSSGSMSSKMDRAKDAVVEFFKTANPQD